MRAPHSRRPRLGAELAFVIVLAAATVAYALPYRQPNCNTGAHFALVQSLSGGTRTIDRIHGESCDVSWWHGHYYANKAPGLALVSVPWYLGLRALGLMQRDPASRSPYPLGMRSLPRRDLWLMGLWGSLLPALGLLALVRSVAEKLEPGTGVVAAAILGFATLLLPFAGLFFAHALSAFLAFAAFALVMDTGPRLWRVAAAGLLAGFAAAVEYPVGLVAAVLLFYVASRSPRLRRAAVFGVSVIVGLVPLLAYGWWAFGSPFHLSYVGAVLVPGLSGHDVLGANSAGFFGITAPRLDHLLQVLVGSRGLLTLGPVLALVPAGCARLWHRGWRPEARFIVALLLLYLLYNAAYYSPLGGATPGPRFLIPIIAFAAITLAPLVSTLPLSLLALSTVSGAWLLAADLTQPLISPPYTTADWWHWIQTGSFTSTVLSPHSPIFLPCILIVAAAAAALTAAALAAWPPDRLDLSTATVALVTWIMAYLSFPHLARSNVGAVALGAAMLVAALAARKGRLGIAIASLSALVIVQVHRHALLSAIAALALALGMLQPVRWTRTRSRTIP